MRFGKGCEYFKDNSYGFIASEFKKITYEETALSIKEFFLVYVIWLLLDF